MERDDLIAIALRHDTTMSDAMLKALGVKRKHRHKPTKRNRYKGARKLMAQKYGVRL